jgi:hypothetical protein
MEDLVREVFLGLFELSLFSIGLVSLTLGISRSYIYRSWFGPRQEYTVIGQPWLCSKAQFGVEAEPVATMGAKVTIPVYSIGYNSQQQ